MKKFIFVSSYNYFYSVQLLFCSCRVFWEKLYKDRKELTSVADHEENIFDRLGQEEEQNALSEMYGTFINRNE